MSELNNSFPYVVFSWIVTNGLKIGLIIAVTFLVRKFSGIFVERLVRKIIVADQFSSEEAEKKREDTLIKIVNGTIGILVLLVAGLMILGELGLDIGPILAAAGIVGLAFGFGGQYLIRDVISGLFITLENQYRVGDVVCFDATCGVVEDITLRKTALRDSDGTLHHIPHGEIKKVSNLTKDYSRVNIKIGIGYDSDIEHVAKVVDEVGQTLATDPDWKNHINKPPRFVRIEDFADSSIVIRILGETKPAKRWEVAGELRKRLKVAFDKNGIDIPFPQRVVHQVKE